MRHRLIGWILVCLFSASVFAPRFSANSPGLRVNESATKFSLQKAGAVVSLAIENSNSSALTARVKPELIDPRVGVAHQLSEKTVLRGGRDVFTAPAIVFGVNAPGFSQATNILPATDREPLERALKESDWSLNHYDVLPDRVIVYLWPPAGALKFSFKFKPRYGVKAQTAPSAPYDYYDPEARVSIAPSRLVVE